MSPIFRLLLTYLFFATALVTVANAQVRKSYVPAPCNINISAACNPSPNNYYAQSTATPVPMASTTWGASTPAPQLNVQGKFAEVVDPQSDSILHITTPNVTATKAWGTTLSEYNLRTNIWGGQAQIESLNCATTGQIHDGGGFVPGPNGEMAILFGAISASGRVTGNNGCTSGFNMCGNAACTTAGTTQATGMPVKFAMPTASPAAVAAATQEYLNVPDIPSEIWSVCFQTIPGDTNTWSNELRRCLWGGQSHNQAKALNGNGSTNWIQQAGGTLHWGSGVMQPYSDTVTSVAASGNCPTGGVGPTGASVGSDTFCYDPINTAIGSATSGAYHMTGASTDNTWKTYQITATTVSTAVSFTTTTFPNTGEPNANGTCTFHVTTTGAESLEQTAIDLANNANNNTINGTTTGNISTAPTCTGITAATFRSNYVVFASPNTGTAPFAFNGSNGVYTSACSTSSECLIIALQPSASYSSSLDMYSSLFDSGTFANADPTCTGCTAISADTTNKGMINLNAHNTVGNCRLLEWYGEEGVCLFDVDHLARGPYTSSSQAVTGDGLALEIACFNKNSYTVANPPSWTFRTCDLNSGSAPAASFTIGVDNNMPNINPANIISPGLPQGTSAACSASLSPWLVCNPTTTSGTVVPFSFDWSGYSDPVITGGGTGTYPAENSWDVTNIIGGVFNSDLMIATAQGNPSSGIPTVVTCVFDTFHAAPATPPRCDQVDSGINFAAATDNITVSLGTGASGTLYLDVATGNSTAHGCTNSCILEYKATPPTTNVAIPWTYFRTINMTGTCTGTIPADGVSSLDQEGGYHMISLGACLTGNSFVYDMYDNIIP